MAVEIQIRRDTAADWVSANPTLGQGEWGLETDTDNMKIGNGASVWTQLPYQVEPFSVIFGLIQSASVGSAALSDPRGYASAASTAAIASAFTTTQAASVQAIAVSESYAIATGASVKSLTLQIANNGLDVNNPGLFRENVHIPALAACQTVATASVNTISPGFGPWDGSVATPGLGSQILLTANSTANGPQVYNGASVSFTRPTDYQTGASVGSRTVQITSGTYANTEWMMGNSGSVAVVDTTATTWTQGYTGTFVPVAGGKILDEGGELFNIRAAAYGAVGDGRQTTVSISGTAITGTGFTSYDNGHTISIPTAGSALCTPTLSSTLSTGSPITSLPVSALATQMPPGDITITQSGHTQVFQTTAYSLVGAISIPVVQMTPTFAFTSAATVSSPLTNFITTVTYNSATSLTAAASAPHAATSVVAGLGTDDTTAIQAAINAAYSGNRISCPKPPGPIGFYYLVVGNLGSTKQGLSFEGPSLEGSGILFGGNGALYTNGVNDDLPYDNNDYSGPQNVTFKNIQLVAVGSTANANAETGLTYAPGSIAIVDWRGGNIRTENVYITGFDFPFWGINSDVNNWKDTSVIGAHSGMYIGPRSDQWNFRGVYWIYCDRALDFDRVAGPTFTGCQIIDSGTATINPIRIRSAWASDSSRAFSFEGLWCEYLIGSNVVEAFIEVGGANGIGDAVQSYGINLRDTSVYNNTVVSGTSTEYLIKVMNATNIMVDEVSGDSVEALTGIFEVVGTYSPYLFYKRPETYIATPIPLTNNGTGGPLLGQMIWPYNGEGGGFYVNGVIGNVQRLEVVGSQPGAFSPNAYIFVDSGSNVSASKGIFLNSAGNFRWSFYAGGDESGSNTGSDLTLNNYNDAGTLLETVMRVIRATGIVTLPTTPAEALGAGAAFRNGVR